MFPQYFRQKHRCGLPRLVSHRVNGPFSKKTCRMTLCSTKRVLATAKILMGLSIRRILMLQCSKMVNPREMTLLWVRVKIRSCLQHRHLLNTTEAADSGRSIPEVESVGSIPNSQPEPVQVTWNIFYVFSPPNYVFVNLPGSDPMGARFFCDVI